MDKESTEISEIDNSTRWENIGTSIRIVGVAIFIVFIGIAIYYAKENLLRALLVSLTYSAGIVILVAGIFALSFRRLIISNQMIRYKSLKTAFKWKEVPMKSVFTYRLHTVGGPDDSDPDRHFLECYDNSEKRVIKVRVFDKKKTASFLNQLGKTKKGVEH